MPSFAFYFDADVFEHKRQLMRAGTSVAIDHVGATPRLPFKDIAAGDELFIVGLSGNHLHLAGRLVVADRPMSRAEAVLRTARHDLVDKALICLADVTRRRNPATQSRHIPASFAGAEGRLERPH